MRRSSRAGFTLIELMISVAIIGILASIAIPNYIRYGLRARSAEAYTMLNVAKNQQYAWLALHDCFVNTEAHPVGVPGPSARPYTSVATGVAAPCDGTARSLVDVGMVPAQGRLYYTYQCVARIPQTLGGVGAHEFACSALGDLDGNSVPSEVIYCTNIGRNPTGYPAPSGTACPFPNETFRASSELF